MLANCGLDGDLACMRPLQPQHASHTWRMVMPSDSPFLTWLDMRKGFYYPWPLDCSPSNAQNDFRA